MIFPSLLPANGEHVSPDTGTIRWTAWSSWLRYTTSLIMTYKRTHEMVVYDDVMTLILFYLIHIQFGYATHSAASMSAETQTTMMISRNGKYVAQLRAPFRFWSELPQTVKQSQRHAIILVRRSGRHDFNSGSISFDFLLFFEMSHSKSILAPTLWPPVLKFLPSMSKPRPRLTPGKRRNRRARLTRPS